MVHAPSDPDGGSELLGLHLIFCWLNGTPNLLHEDIEERHPRFYCAGSAVEQFRDAGSSSPTSGRDRRRGVLQGPDASHLGRALSVLSQPCTQALWAKFRVFRWHEFRWGAWAGGRGGECATEPALSA